MRRVMVKFPEPWIEHSRLWWLWSQAECCYRVAITSRAGSFARRCPLAFQFITSFSRLLRSIERGSFSCVRAREVCSMQNAFCTYILFYPRECAGAYAGRIHCSTSKLMRDTRVDKYFSTITMLHLGKECPKNWTKSLKPYLLKYWTTQSTISSFVKNHQE